MIRVSIVGASGYVGGELLRLLLRHPHVTIQHVTSERLAGKPVTGPHPHLRGFTDLTFTSQSELEACDVLILALPHGSAAKKIDYYASLAPRIVDCSADFRLRNPADYVRWYGEAHPNPAWLERFVYGLPELNRAALVGATHVSGVGCNATATTLALLPLVRAGIISAADLVISDVKVGSSEGGAQGNDGSHHPERSGVVRAFAPTGHRHTAEVMQATGLSNVHLSITSVELVRVQLPPCSVSPLRPWTKRHSGAPTALATVTSRLCASCVNARASTACPSPNCWVAPTSPMWDSTATSRAGASSASVPLTT